MIKLKIAGFYFFSWEIELMKKAGFSLQGVKKRTDRIYFVEENPEPVKVTERRLSLIRELVGRAGGFGYSLDNRRKGSYD